MNEESIESVDRYHELLLNDSEEHVSQNQIYGIKYSALVLCFTLILNTREKIDKLEQRLENYIVYYSFISITIAFIISCYSSFIGHKKLFIGSFIAFSTCFLILYSEYLGPNIILSFFIKLSREILNIQIYIQICGQWPSQYVRVLVELLLISFVLIVIISQVRLPYQIFLYIYLIFIPFVLFLIVKGVSSFQQPSTKSVIKDIFKAVFHYKPLVFTLLFASTFFLFLFQFIYLLMNIRENKLGVYEMEISLMILMALSAFLLWKIRTVKQQSTLIFAIAILILEILGLLLLVGITKIPYALPFYYAMPINVIFYCLIYTVPQYQVILRNINIKNLDFASSYQQFAYIMIDTSISCLAQNKAQAQFLLEYINLFISLSIGAVVVFGIIFYHFLGFKSYFYKWNQSQVQEQELEATQI